MHTYFNLEEVEKKCVIDDLVALKMRVVSCELTP